MYNMMTEQLNKDNFRSLGREFEFSLWSGALSTFISPSSRCLAQFSQLSLGQKKYLEHAMSLVHVQRYCEIIYG